MLLWKYLQFVEHIIDTTKQIEVRTIEAYVRANRARGAVKLLATMTIAPERISPIFKVGYTGIAENRVQELKEKYETLGDGHSPCIAIR